MTTVEPAEETKSGLGHDEGVSDGEEDADPAIAGLSVVADAEDDGLGDLTQEERELLEERRAAEFELVSRFDKVCYSLGSGCPACVLERALTWSWS